ncbi:MAG TPA: hypothetical protein VJV79_31340 [Polyangiaceae bacterium]|nr:hypothetical protein [Polyangiaceae bacterium]
MSNSLLGSWLVAWLCLCSGCGATGLDWVGEAHLASAQQQTVNTASAASSRRPATASIPATAQQDASEPRPRLNRTVTLGEMDVADARVAGSGPPSGASVNIYNYNYNQVNVPPPSFGYGTFGYSGTRPGFVPARVTPLPSRPGAASPQPGQNWPAVADHGPSFPYQSLPASPWTRTQ